MTYETDIAEKLGGNEELTNRRTRSEGSRGNVDIEEFDIVDADGRLVGVLTVRESMDPSPPFFTERTVTRQIV